jgi:hypothetical protein
LQHARALIDEDRRQLLCQFEVAVEAGEHAGRSPLGDTLAGRWSGHGKLLLRTQGPSRAVRAGAAHPRR